MKIITLFPESTKPRAGMSKISNEPSRAPAGGSVRRAAADRVDVSSHGQALAAALQELVQGEAAEDSARADRIAELRARLEANDYPVNSRELAEAILADLIRSDTEPPAGGPT
ncbi:MAG: flagellar biosynthesis anti-sigma factor FlgM [Deltaproteobacteria bacterium]|nr:flagellar biosynthesis anti-sigma factor FlgM [Deltaproteobacteria bacterium]